MIRFLTVLFGFASELFSAWRQASWKRQGRQETIKEMNDALNEQVQQAEQAAANPTADELERMRSRFDRSRSD